MMTMNQNTLIQVIWRIMMTTEERLERIESMLRYIIREITYVPEAPKKSESKPKLVLLRDSK
jgi:hypothetical protein